MKAAARVKMRKWMGDDRYSWAVFVDGRPKWDGLSRDQAAYYRDREVAELEGKKQ